MASKLLSLNEVMDGLDGSDFEDDSDDDTWTWTKNRETKEKVGVALRNNFVHTGRAPKGLTMFMPNNNYEL